MKSFIAMQGLGRLASGLAIMGIVAVTAPAVSADSLRASAQGSMNISRGSANIVEGSARVLAAGGEFIVQSVRRTATGTVIVLKSVSDGARVSVGLAGAAATAAGDLAGQTVQAIGTAGGYVLHRSGEVIAFIPNELGKRLVYDAERAPAE